MWDGANAGVIVPQQARSVRNTTPTTLELFVTEVFAPAYLLGLKAAHALLKTTKHDTTSAPLERTRVMANFLASGTTHTPPQVQA